MPIITTLAIVAASGFVGTKVLQHKQLLPNRGSSATERWQHLLQNESLEDDVQNEMTLGDKEAKHHDRYLAISAASLGIAVTGAFVTFPLGAIAATGIMYTTVPLIMDAYEGLKVHRLRSTIIESAAISTLVLGHFYIVGGLSCVLYYGGVKLMMLSEDRSRESLVNIFGEQPRTVWVQQGEDIDIEIPFEQLKQGDVVVVNAGQAIPVDGVITRGAASVDQHALTGESQPIEKEAGDSVLAATVVLSGNIYIEVQETGGATVAAQIGSILEQTVDYRTTVEVRSEQLMDQGVLPILGLAGLAFTSSGPVGAAAVLNSYFSDGLRLSSPLSMLNFLNTASNQGILVKDGRVLELVSTVDTVVFDKTGTLTLEEPHIGRIHTFNNWSEDELLRYTAAVEAKQSHPIARAIVQSAETRNLTLPTIEDSAYKLGYGIEASIGDYRVQIGSARFMQMVGVDVSAEAARIAQTPSAQTASLVYVAINTQLAGILEMHPTMRPEAQSVINALKDRGLELVIISGDHTQPTQALANDIGIDRYFAEVLPQDKAALVAQLQEEGKRVCFVGDGINDAIALKTATVSISLSGATSAATDTAQAILMDGTLAQLPQLFEIGDRFSGNMRGNIVAAAGPAVVSLGGIFFLGTGVPLAILLYNVSVAGSLANAILPAWWSERGSAEPKQLVA